MVTHFLCFLQRVDLVKQMANSNVLNHFCALFLCPLSMVAPHSRTSHPPRCQLHQLYNSSGVEGAEGPQVLEECPGQTFQVSLLLSHLLAAPAYTSDVLLQPYLSSWDELVK